MFFITIQFGRNAVNSNFFWTGQIILVTSQMRFTGYSTSGTIRPKMNDGPNYDMDINFNDNNFD